MKLINFAVILFTAFPLFLLAQENIDAEIEAQAIGSTGGVVPFWMRSNQFGAIPLSGASGSFIGRIHKEYNKSSDGYLTEPKLFDWGMGFEGRTNTGKKQEFLLVEAYLKAHLGPFELKAGRAKETMGLTGDTSLSSGSFAVSGNALGIPKIQISIPEYYTLPAFNGLFALKGNFAHGWIGKSTIQSVDTNKLRIDSYLHQKSFYGRLGKQDAKLKLYGGFNHQVIWGNEQDIYGTNYTLSDLKTYLFVVTGTPYGNPHIPKSKIGNQVGSIDLGFSYQFNSFEIMVYRQNIYDVGALYYLANIRDGLNGITYINKSDFSKELQLKKLVFEFLFTKNQAGESWSRITKSGDENYYNNYMYAEGWSYSKQGIGTPMISTKASTRSGLISDPVDYFINNRVIAVHLALEGKVKSWNYTAKGTYSRNYGTYATSPLGQSLGSKRYPPKYGIFKELSQFSAYLEGNKNLNNGLKIGYELAFDKGHLLNSSFGLNLKLSKHFR